MENDMPVTMRGPKSTPEVEFQYVGRLISKAGSRNVSAVVSGISSKFGLQVCDVVRIETGS